MDDSEYSDLRVGKALTKQEGRTLDRNIANRIIEVCGKLDEVGVPKGINKLLKFVGAPVEGFPPALSDRWVFPSVSHRRASDHATRMVHTSRGHDTASLRLVTIRFGERKPSPSELGEHLVDLGKALNWYVDYLARQGLAQPLLSALVRPVRHHREALRKTYVVISGSLCGARYPCGRWIPCRQGHRGFLQDDPVLPRGRMDTH